MELISVAELLGEPEEWPLTDQAVTVMADLAEVTGDRRNARLLRTALRMRQARPKLDLDKMTREWGLE